MFLNLAILASVTTLSFKCDDNLTVLLDLDTFALYSHKWQSNIKAFNLV